MHSTIRSFACKKLLPALCIAPPVGAPTSALAFAADIRPGLSEMRVDQTAFLDVDKLNDEMRKQMEAFMIRPAQSLAGPLGNSIN